MYTLIIRTNYGRELRAYGCRARIVAIANLLVKFENYPYVAVCFDGDHTYWDCHNVNGRELVEFVKETCI